MLVDNHSRVFKYLRLSVTEKCNFRCSYCLPDGYKGCPKTSFLNLSEIHRLAQAFKDLGVRKIRLTGGEPTLRGDLVEIISDLKVRVGIEEVALTTNGFILDRIAPRLRAAGLDAINISLDSLNPRSFQKICGMDKGESVLRSIDQCLDLGFRRVKVNCVLLRGINDHEFEHFIEFVQARPVSVRFIELMRTGDNRDYFTKHHRSLDPKIEELKALGWTEVMASETGGPAKEFQAPGFAGKIGFISPYSKNFCSTCNRLRISATGGLRLCLFGMGDLTLRDLLQEDSQQKELMDRVVAALKLKPEGHRLHENVYGDMRSLSAIGG